MFGEARDRVAGVRQKLESLMDPQLVTLLNSALEGVDDSPQSALLGQVLAAMRKLANKLGELATAADEAFDTALGDITAARDDWRTATSPQRDGHSEVLRQLVEEAMIPRRTSSQRRLSNRSMPRRGVGPCSTRRLPI